MRPTWFLGLAACLLTSLGCELTDEEIRPPEPAEEWNVPDPKDPRYGKFVEYPKDLLNKPLQRQAGPTPGSGLPGRGQRPGIGLNGLRPGSGPSGF